MTSVDKRLADYDKIFRVNKILKIPSTDVLGIFSLQPKFSESAGSRRPFSDLSI